MRSFRLPDGLKYSTLTSSVALIPAEVGMRLSRTSGVRPMASKMERW
jgi:hypothetical protein